MTRITGAVFAQEAGGGQNTVKFEVAEMFRRDQVLGVVTGGGKLFQQFVGNLKLGNVRSSATPRQPVVRNFADIQTLGVSLWVACPVKSFGRATFGVESKIGCFGQVVDQRGTTGSRPPRHQHVCLLASGDDAAHETTSC